RVDLVTGVQTCALPISAPPGSAATTVAARHRPPLAGVVAFHRRARALNVGTSPGPAATVTVTGVPLHPCGPPARTVRDSPRNARSEERRVARAGSAGRA